MSYEKVLKEQNDKLLQQVKKLEQNLQAKQHELKKTIMQSKTKLDFQTARADEYEEKYKSVLQYKNQQESLRQLDEKLRQKEDEILRLINQTNEKALESQQLYEELQALRKENSNLNSDLNQIKEAALNAIMDKDATIAQLTEKLEQVQDGQTSNKLRQAILDLEDRYKELEQHNQVTKTQLSSQIEEKDSEISELQEKIMHVKEKNEERTVRLEQEIADLQRHLEQATALKDHQQNLEEKYYHTEQKLRKTQKRLFDLEQTYQQQVIQKQQSFQKLEHENEQLKAGVNELKELKDKFKEFNKQYSSQKRELQEWKDRFERSNIETQRKIGNLDTQKKILADSLNLKQQQIQKLRAELEVDKEKQPPSLSKQKSIGNISPQKLRDDENALVDNLKKQIKDRDETIESLKKKLEQQTKELQQARQKLLQLRGSQGTNPQVNTLKKEIETLTSYIKRVENQMLTKKMAHAQDEAYWAQKEKKYKDQFDQAQRKFKRQNSDLLERIDRMKKLVPKDKKTDYYQSGFK